MGAVRDVFLWSAAPEGPHKSPLEVGGQVSLSLRPRPSVWEETVQQIVPQGHPARLPVFQSPWAAPFSRS